MGYDVCASQVLRAGVFVKAVRGSLGTVHVCAWPAAGGSAGTELVAVPRSCDFVDEAQDTRALVSELCSLFYTLGWVTGTGGSIRSVASRAPA